MTWSTVLFFLLFWFSVISTADETGGSSSNNNNNNDLPPLPKHAPSSSSYVPLSPVDKLVMVALALIVIAITIVCVLCLVLEGCLLNRMCCKQPKPVGMDSSDGRKHKRKKVPPKAPHMGYILEEGMNAGDYGTNGAGVPYSGSRKGRHQFRGEGEKQQAARGGESMRLDPFLGQAVTDDDFEYDEEAGEQEALFMSRSLTEEAGAEIAAEAGRGAVAIDRGSRRRRSRTREHKPMRKQVLQAQASTASSATTVSGGSRKDSIMSAVSSSSSSAFSILNVRPSSESKELDTEGSSSGVFSRSGSREKKLPASPSPTVTILLRLSEVNEEAGKLTITVQQVVDLPPRDYGAPCDPMLKLTLHRDRRSLRKKSRQILAEFRTSIVKHENNPKFEETFETEVSMADYKNFRLKLTALDCDRHSKRSEVGSCSILLKEVKALTPTNNEQDVSVTNTLAQKKQEFGEIHFGMSYLPTAQRLSFSIGKATNLKYQEITEKLDNFAPYVRVLQINATGRIIKKKKTNAKAATANPVFNETLTFDLSHEQLESNAFLVLISNKELSIELQDMDSTSSNPSGAMGASPPSPSPLPGHLTDRSDYSAPASSETGGSSVHYPRHRGSHGGSRHKDACLGRVCVGASVRGEKERAHWRAVVRQPREIVNRSHTLH